MRDGLTTTGRTKLSAAVEAAAAFVATMALPQDQAAVVAFNDDAQVVQPLTGERSDIEAAQPEPDATADPDRPAADGD